MSALLDPPRDGEVAVAPAADGGGSAVRADLHSAPPPSRATRAPPPRPGEDWPLRFQIGARTLVSVSRRLRRLPSSLEDALAGHGPTLPPPALGEDGYLVTSLPEAALGTLLAEKCPRPQLSATGLIPHVRQRYRRYWIDLAAGEAAWRAGLSANARAQMKRKAKRLGNHAVEHFRTAEEIAAFHPVARFISARTYQERLLGSGLPGDPAALVAPAAADRVRAWLLRVGGEPVAYLCCTADGDTLRYDHVGHDPAWNEHSPGAVLQAAALADLFADRFARFDFTEGEGQHKRQLATAGVDCLDLLLLRPTLANRALLGGLKGWDAAVAGVKRVEWLKAIGAKLRR